MGTPMGAPNTCRVTRVCKIAIFDWLPEHWMRRHTTENWDTVPLKMYVRPDGDAGHKLFMRIQSSTSSTTTVSLDKVHCWKFDAEYPPPLFTCSLWIWSVTCSICEVEPSTCGVAVLESSNNCTRLCSCLFGNWHVNCHYSRFYSKRIIACYGMSNDNK